MGYGIWDMGYGIWDMGTMFLNELKVMKVLKVLKVLKILKQAHIELIRSNRFEADRYYPL
jgi:hypothetical protein